MKKEDFINITDNMFDICEKLASNGGNCKEINCEDCPFSKKNSTNDKPCNNNGYTTHTALKQEKDYALVQSAIKFLGFKNNNEVTFHNAKVGDRVWDYLYGWGTIKKTNFDIDYPILVKYDNEDNHESFTYEGFKNLIYKNPTLFWNEIKFETPEKPFNLENELKQLEIKEFVSNEDNFYLEWDNNANKIRYGQRCYCQQPFDIYFEEESVKNFMNNIKDKNITKEQFFEAYKKVFKEQL